jgi:hypothetical protein
MGSILPQPADLAREDPGADHHVEIGLPAATPVTRL